MSNTQKSYTMEWLEALRSLQIPHHRSDVTAWHGHLPLAFFIMAAAQPAVFVELGTHKGDSYCAFCQAVESASLSTRCFAVDTWKGDEHAGHYSEAIYEELKSYHDPLYGRFSTLLRCTFDNALQYFADGSIDLLHIDGLHTYEAVKNDFYKWLPKLSERALVLLHDVEVREREFGVWRFWEELRSQYPTFVSPISNGLGVAAVGKHVPQSLRSLFYETNVSEPMKDIISYMGTLIMESDSLRAAAKVSFSTEITQHATAQRHSLEEDADKFFQIYFGDTREDFSEESSVKKSIPFSENIWGCDDTFLIRRPCGSVRIDPINDTAQISNLQIFVSSGSEYEFREIDLSLMHFVGIVHHKNEWICVGNDPQVILSGLTLQTNDLLRVRFSLNQISTSEVAVRINEWMHEQQRSLVSIVEESQHNVEQLLQQKEQYADLLEEINILRDELVLAKVALKQSNQELYLKKTENNRLEAALSHAQSLRGEAESQWKERQTEYENVLDQLEQSRSELSAMLATKGWRLLNILRTLRKFLRHPALTARKVYASYRQLGLRTTITRVADKLSREAVSVGNTVSYDKWQRDHETQFLMRSQDISAEIDGWAKKPLISVIMPTYNSKVNWLQEAVSSLLKQPYDNWELLVSDDHSPNADTIQALEEMSQLDERVRVLWNEENQGISGNTNMGILAAKGDLITFLDHDDILTPNALYEVVKAWNDCDFDILYSDEDKLGDAEYEDAFFKPDYSPDYLLSCNYFNHLTVYRRTILDRVGLLRSDFDGAQDYDLLLRATEIATTIVHVPQILYHWRKVPGSTAASFDAKSYAHDAGRRAIEEALVRRGERGKVLDTGYPGHYRVDRELVATPLVSIIIPMRDKHEVLKNCLESLRKSTYRNLEILIVDNGSQEQATLDYLATLKDCLVLRYDIPFNYSRLNNWAAKEAKGDYLIFLNNDIEVITFDWIEQMLQHTQRPGIGVVGAKLLYPDGRIQHAGVVLGIGGVADHAHKFNHRDSPGYFGTLIDTRNYSAVTGACMLVQKSVFHEVEGFDEDNLAIAFNDIDLCLKIGNVGLRCVWTPYAQLYHHESLTRGSELSYHEIFYMQRRWGERLWQDPFYNRNLTLLAKDFTFDPTRSQGNGADTYGIYERSFMKSLKVAIPSVEGFSAWSNDEGVKILARIFAMRFDLQNTFMRGMGDVDVEGIMHWIIKHGAYEDSAHDLLRPHITSYARLLKEINHGIDLMVR